jgi:hypothetical protein
MKGSSAKRAWLLALALAATVAAAGWVRSKEQSGVVAVVASTPRNGAPAERAEPQQQRRDAANPGATGSTIEMEKLSQRPVDRKFGEMFYPRSWQPPPPPVSARAPERPTAPPLPFSFFGRLVDDGTTVVFLNRQDDIYAVKAGDTIDGAYRIEEINGSAVVLTYLPLKQRQTLQIGSIQ